MFLVFCIMYVCWLGGQGGRQRDRLSRTKAMAFPQVDMDALRFKLLDLVEVQNEPLFKVLKQCHTETNSKLVAIALLRLEFAYEGPLTHLNTKQRLSMLFDTSESSPCFLRVCGLAA